MRLLRGSLHWGFHPQTPGIYRFFSARMDWRIYYGDRTIPSPPFQPLNRSLGLLPSIALSRPVQVGSISTKPFGSSTKKHRMAITPLTSCLTFGVHRTPVLLRPYPYSLRLKYLACFESERQH